jgi:hypothetical protein
LLTAEAAIMAVDIDKVAPYLKNYYIGLLRTGASEDRWMVTPGCDE